jgi:hypothetical protein
VTGNIVFLNVGCSRQITGHCTHGYVLQNWWLSGRSNAKQPALWWRARLPYMANTAVAALSLVSPQDTSATRTTGKVCMSVLLVMLCTCCLLLPPPSAVSCCLFAV